MANQPIDLIFMLLIMAMVNVLYIIIFLSPAIIQFTDSIRDCDSDGFLGFGIKELRVMFGVLLFVVVLIFIEINVFLLKSIFKSIGGI